MRILNQNPTEQYYERHRLLLQEARETPRPEARVVQPERHLREHGLAANRRLLATIPRLMGTDSIPFFRS